MQKYSPSWLMGESETFYFKSNLKIVWNKGWVFFFFFKNDWWHLAKLLQAFQEEWPKAGQAIWQIQNRFFFLGRKKRNEKSVHRTRLWKRLEVVRKVERVHKSVWTRLEKGCKLLSWVSGCWYPSLHYSNCFVCLFRIKNKSKISFGAESFSPKGVQTFALNRAQF